MLNSGLLLNELNYSHFHSSGNLRIYKRKLAIFNKQIQMRQKTNSVKFETLLQCDSVLKSAIYLKCHWFQSIIICSSQCAQIHRSPTIQLHIPFDSALLSSCTTSISPWIYFSIVLKADNTKSRIYFTCIYIPITATTNARSMWPISLEKKRILFAVAVIVFVLIFFVVLPLFRIDSIVIRFDL